MKGTTIIGLVLALIAATVYFLMGTNVITVPSLNEDAPAAIVFVAGGCYVLGALLILLRKRWLWIIGLVMNTLVIAIFFMMYNQKPDVMFSLPGLATKIPQILLELGLIYLIGTHPKNIPMVRQTA